MLATADRYTQMLADAASHGFAYPAINVSSSQTLNAAVAGFVDANSDGIIQVSLGSAAYLAGPGGSAVDGALALAAFAHRAVGVAPVTIALHTDHCPPGHVDDFLDPLLDEAAARVDAGEAPPFASHMFDGSSLDHAANVERSVELLRRCAPLGVLLEEEVGPIGGEEDGQSHEIDERIYAQPADIDDMCRHLDAVSDRYLVAAAFGNVHGFHAAANVELRPEILHDAQNLVARRPGRGPVPLVFHGGSGTPDSIVDRAIRTGVVKVNLDSGAQLAFSTAVADHMVRHVEVAGAAPRLTSKATYDPRRWGSPAEAAMAGFVAAACHRFGSAGRSRGG
jgi:fructose-bisphosphate aldolase, class II